MEVRLEVEAQGHELAHVILAGMVGQGRLAIERGRFLEALRPEERAGGGQRILGRGEDGDEHRAGDHGSPEGAARPHGGHPGCPVHRTRRHATPNRMAMQAQLTSPWGTEK